MAVKQHALAPSPLVNYGAKASPKTAFSETVQSVRLFPVTNTTAVSFVAQRPGLCLQILKSSLARFISFFIARILLHVE